MIPIGLCSRRLAFWRPPAARPGLRRLCDPGPIEHRFVVVEDRRRVMERNSVGGAHYTGVLMHCQPELLDRSPRF